MFLKKYKPLNSSLRFRVNIDKKSLNMHKFKRLFFKKKIILVEIVSVILLLDIRVVVYLT